MMLARIVLAAASAALFVPPAVGNSPARQSVNTLVYDHVKRTLCWAEKPVQTEEDRQAIVAGTTPCPDELLWNPGVDYFRSGDVVRVRILHARFYSVFTVKANAVEITSEDAGIHGIPDAPLTFTNPATKAKDSAAQKAAGDILKEELDRLVKRSQTLESQSAAALTAVTKRYSNRAQFDDLTEGTDALVERIRGIAPALCNIGDDAEIAAKLKTLNSSLALLFANLNDLWRKSEDAEASPLLHLGQWSGSQHVDFTISETSRYRPYNFASDSASACGGSKDKGKPAKVDDQASASRIAPRVRPAVLFVARPAAVGSADRDAEETADADTPKDAKPSQPEGGGGEDDFTPIYDNTFDVHEIRRGNVVSGFFASSLRNREYGVSKIRATDDNGKSRTDSNGNPVFVNVPQVGPARRPQTHYYVGIDFYFKARDFFPGYGSWVIPSLLVGYGADDSFNFLFGPNFETKMGINVGVGLHLGREKFLPPGVVAGPGGTQLADSATTVDVVNRFAKGVYVNVGFDLKTMKNVFGGLIGLK